MIFYSFAISITCILNQIMHFSCSIKIFVSCFLHDGKFDQQALFVNLRNAVYLV